MKHITFTCFVLLYWATATWALSPETQMLTAEASAAAPEKPIDWNQQLLIQLLGENALQLDDNSQFLPDLVKGRQELSLGLLYQERNVATVVLTHKRTRGDHFYFNVTVSLAGDKNSTNVGVGTLTLAPLHHEQGHDTQVTIFSRSLLRALRTYAEFKATAQTVNSNALNQRHLQKLEEDEEKRREKNWLKHQKQTEANATAIATASAAEARELQWQHQQQQLEKQKQMSEVFSLLGLAFVELMTGSGNLDEAIILLNQIKNDYASIYQNHLHISYVVDAWLAFATIGLLDKDQLDDVWAQADMLSLKIHGLKSIKVELSQSFCHLFYQALAALKDRYAQSESENASDICSLIDQTVSGNFYSLLQKQRNDYLENAQTTASLLQGKSLSDYVVLGYFNYLFFVDDQDYDYNLNLLVIMTFKTLLSNIDKALKQDNYELAERLHKKAKTLYAALKKKHAHLLSVDQRFAKSIVCINFSLDLLDFMDVKISIKRSIRNIRDHQFSLNQFSQTTSKLRQILNRSDLSPASQSYLFVQTLKLLVELKTSFRQDLNYQDEALSQECLAMFCELAKLMPNISDLINLKLKDQPNVHIRFEDHFLFALFEFYGHQFIRQARSRQIERVEQLWASYLDLLDVLGYTTLPVLPEAVQSAPLVEDQVLLERLQKAFNEFIKNTPHQRQHRMLQLAVDTLRLIREKLEGFAFAEWSSKNIQKNPEKALREAQKEAATPIEHRLKHHLLVNLISIYMDKKDFPSLKTVLSLFGQSQVSMRPIDVVIYARGKLRLFINSPTDQRPELIMDILALFAKIKDISAAQIEQSSDLKDSLIALWTEWEMTTTPYRTTINATIVKMAQDLKERFNQAAVTQLLLCAKASYLWDRQQQQWSIPLKDANNDQVTTWMKLADAFNIQRANYLEALKFAIGKTGTLPAINLGNMQGRMKAWIQTYKNLQIISKALTNLETLWISMQANNTANTLDSQVKEWSAKSKDKMPLDGLPDHLQQQLLQSDLTLYRLRGDEEQPFVSWSPDRDLQLNITSTDNEESVSMYLDMIAQGQLNIYA